LFLEDNVDETFPVRMMHKVIPSINSVTSWSPSIEFYFKLKITDSGKVYFLAKVHSKKKIPRNGKILEKYLNYMIEWLLLLLL